MPGAFLNHAGQVRIAAAVASASHVVQPHNDQSLTVFGQDFTFNHRGEELVSRQSLFIIVAVADQAPINCRIGGEHADALGGGKAVVNLAHDGDKVGLDGRLPAQDLGGVAPDLGDLVEGNVFAIFVAVKNGLIKRIAAFQHQRASPLSELRIADQLDVELAIGALPVVFAKDRNRVAVEQRKHSGDGGPGSGLGEGRKRRRAKFPAQ